MIVCLCYGVPDSAIRATIASGAATVADIRRACGAGGDCGSCCQMLRAMVNEVRGACASLGDGH